MCWPTKCGGDREACCGGGQAFVIEGAGLCSNGCGTVFCIQLLSNNFHLPGG